MPESFQRSLPAKFSQWHLTLRTQEWNPPVVLVTTELILAFVNNGGNVI